MTTTTKTEQADAAAKLRAIIPPGTTIYTILRHVSDSGMKRVISLIAIDEERKPRDVSRLAQRALGMRFDDKRHGVCIHGAGMDMGFDLVHSLSYAIHKRGDALSHEWI